MESVMSASKVYFTDMRCPVGTSLLQKLTKLLRKAGVDAIDMENKFAAIKLHFGEPGNLSFLRPNFAKTVADLVREKGGLPFLTDCNTLYVGRRKHALEHLAAAQENGYSPLSTGCQIIIGDGLKGTDDVEVPVTGGTHFTSARIGRAIMDADIFISLNHFKGHEMTGFGGAIKNIGMGCGSRGIGTCNFDAISNAVDAESTILNERMAEYTQAVLAGRPHFHVSVVNQVSPCCDCHGENDAAIVPDLGIFVSFDPVALDHACIDAVNAAPMLPNSALAQCAHTHNDHFTDIHPTTHWRSQLEHAQRLGIGSMDYELITV